MPRTKPLIETPVETLGEVETKTHCHPLRDVKIEAISVTLGEVKAGKLTDAWGDTVARVEIRTVDGTLRQLKPNYLKTYRGMLRPTLWSTRCNTTLVEAEVQTLDK